MSVIQSKQEEVRYIKRQNLDEESKLYQNYFRDIIHNFGVDCNYYKLRTDYPKEFRRTLDDNNILLHAYGQDSNPKFDVSADIIGYMEVDQDVFQLSKWGIVPQPDVTFTFDRNEFATKFANKMGQYKEFKINETRFDLEIPKNLEDSIKYMNSDGTVGYYRLEDDIGTYAQSVGVPISFESDILSGRASFVVGDYEIGKEYDIRVDRYQHSGGGYSIPVNENIYRSFYYNADIKEYLDIFLFVKFTVDDVQIDTDYDGSPVTKRILHGKTHGSILFHDVTEIGKYMELIHPNVGDVITIDFPDERSREQYEITECLDKNLANDGINPLLHKYVWKCKARRYINSGEDNPEYNEQNERLNETLDTIQQSEEDIASKISMYDETNNDAVYGGYELERKETDKQIVDRNIPSQGQNVFIDDGSFLSIHAFPNGSRLVTDGFELFFVTSSGNQEIIQISEAEADPIPFAEHWTKEGLDHIVANDHEVFFKNLDGHTYRICSDKPISDEEREICTNSILDATFSTGEVNSDGDMMYKFKNCRTFLISIGDSLFCRFGKGGKRLVKIA